MVAIMKYLQYIISQLSVQRKMPEVIFAAKFIMFFKL